MIFTASTRGGRRRRPLGQGEDRPAPGPAAARARRADEVRRAVIDVALEHHLVSPYTSLVAVDVTPARPAGEGIESHALETNLPEGWDYTSVFGLGQGATRRRSTWRSACRRIALAALSYACASGRPAQARSAGRGGRRCRRGAMNGASWPTPSPSLSPTGGEGCGVGWRLQSPRESRDRRPVAGEGGGGPRPRPTQGPPRRHRSPTSRSPPRRRAHRPRPLDPGEGAPGPAPPPARVGARRRRGVRGEAVAWADTWPVARLRVAGARRGPDRARRRQRAHARVRARPRPGDPMAGRRPARRSSPRTATPTSGSSAREAGTRSSSRCRGAAVALHGARDPGGHRLAHRGHRERAVVGEPRPPHVLSVRRRRARRPAPLPRRRRRREPLTGCALAKVLPARLACRSDSGGRCAPHCGGRQCVTRWIARSAGRWCGASEDLAREHELDPAAVGRRPSRRSTPRFARVKRPRPRLARRPEGRFPAARLLGRARARESRSRVGARHRAPPRAARRALHRRRAAADLVGHRRPPRRRRPPERPRRADRRGAGRGAALRRGRAARRRQEPGRHLARQGALERPASLAHRPLRRGRATRACARPARAAGAAWRACPR